MDIARSVNGVPIRLTEERWWHIVNEHDELEGYYDDVLRTVDRPEVVIRESGGALIALRSYGRNRYLTVPRAFPRRWVYHHSILRQT
jgi:hypothetical protein